MDSNTMWNVPVVIKENMTIIASIICGALICWVIVAVWKNYHRDFWQEEQDAREAYYDKIIKK